MFVTLDYTVCLCVWLHNTEFFFTIKISQKFYVYYLATSSNYKLSKCSWQILGDL